MNSAKFENVLYFDCLCIERKSPSETKVYPNGEILYFNIQTPFVAEKVKQTDGEFLQNVLRIDIDKNRYYVWEDDFVKSLML